jgi:UDP-N-acetylglucosamine acyltransferase
LAIHPTAIVDSAAEIDPSVDIGAYAVVEGPVRIAAGARIYHHAYVTSWTEIGPKCEVHPFAIVGHLPQDFHFGGERTYCRIGAGTVVREYATIHRGTQPESATVVGQDCFLLAYSHLGHNCVIGDKVTIINSANLGGHVEVGTGAVISAGAMMHQFLRIGEYAMIGGNAELTLDALPFMTTQMRNLCSGPNVVGLRRNGFSPDEIAELRQAYKLIFRSGAPISRAMSELESTVQTDAGRRLLAFMQAPSKRGLGAGPRHAFRRSNVTSGA